MTDSDIQIDDEIQTNPKSKNEMPTWVVILVVLPFILFATVLAMQIMELVFYKAPGPNGGTLFPVGY